MPLPEPVPDVASLDLLVSVGRLGSISAAASVHGVTQPAASMRLRGLERTLGLVLLERSPTGASLTAAGATVAEWADAVLDAVRSLQVGATALRRSERSPLRIAASLTVADYLLPGWLQRMAADVTGTGVSLQMGNTAHVAELVADGAVELGFIEGADRPGRLQVRDLGTDRLLIVVHPGHPWGRRRRPLHAAEVAATPLVVREPGSGTREVLVAALAAHGLQMQASMELGSTAAIKAAAIAGSGPAVLSALAVDGEVRAGRLVAVTVPDLDLERTIRAVWRSGRSPTGAAARLLAIASEPPPPPPGSGGPHK